MGIDRLVKEIGLAPHESRRYERRSYLQNDISSKSEVYNLGSRGVHGQE